MGQKSDREKFIMKRVREHYNEIKNKYEVVGIFLQGSQNYELDIYEENGYKSDIDTKAIILPSFEDIVYNREPISTTLVLDNNEHIDLKDIRVMLDTFKKQNINFIEILFTKFKIINPKYKELIRPLIANRERIARLDYNKALNCMAGMSEQKYVALEHPYPACIDDINNYGYCRKQLHHILRLNDFIRKYIKGLSYKKCLIPNNKEWLIEIKKKALTLDRARNLAQDINKENYQLVKDNKKDINQIDTNVIELLNQVKYDLLKFRFKEELSKSEGK